MFGLFKKRADPRLLADVAGKIREKLDTSVNRFCDSRQISSAEIGEAIRIVVDAQMFVVSFSTSLFNYCLIDACYDAGLADPLTGKLAIKLDPADARHVLRQAWSSFQPPVRANLDMRYRYMLVECLATPHEQETWERMERWSERATSDHFEMQQPLRTGWLTFIQAVGVMDIAGARAALDNPYS